jgi:ABC-type uncharacterized transport system permease subunit
LVAVVVVVVAVAVVVVVVVEGVVRLVCGRSNVDRHICGVAIAVFAYQHQAQRG